MVRNFAVVQYPSVFEKLDCWVQVKRSTSFMKHKLRQVATENFFSTTITGHRCFSVSPCAFYAIRMNSCLWVFKMLTVVYGEMLISDNDILRYSACCIPKFIEVNIDF